MFKYILLGIVQGLAEFFPVSSSGHLVILQKVFGMHKEGLALSVVLHLGTICSLILFFFRDICEALRNKKTLFFITVVTIITGIIGVLGRDFFESLFSSVRLIAVALAITGVILILTRKFREPKREALTLWDALILGFTQAIAIIPGISRSGITISTLLFRKIDKNTCFKFSFLASMPAVIGAALLEARKINLALQENFYNFSVGFLFSFLSGLFALWLLKKILNKARLHYFGYYCILVAYITLLFVK